MPELDLIAAIDVLPLPAALVDPKRWGAPVVLANQRLRLALGADPVGMLRDDLAAQVDDVLIITRGGEHQEPAPWNEHAGIFARDTIHFLLRGGTLEDAIAQLIVTLDSVLSDARVAINIRRAPHAPIEWFAGDLPDALRDDVMAEATTCWHDPEDRDTPASWPVASGLGERHGYKGVWASSGYSADDHRIACMMVWTNEVLPHSPIDIHSLNMLTQTLVLLVRLNEHREELERQQSELAERLTAELTRKFIRASSLDLRRPMQALVSGLELLARDATSETRATVTQMMGSVTRTREILDGLLDLERIEEGSITPRLQPIPLGEIVELATREYHPMAEARGLKLQVEETELWVTTDAMLSVRLLENLISNAVRHTSRGVVRIWFEAKDDQVEIFVNDTGPGIDDRSLLEPFERHPPMTDWAGPERRAPRPTPSTAISRAERLGLGLAIIEAFAGLLGIAVYATSRRRHGTTFSFRLPIAQPAAINAGLTPHLSQGSESLRLLFIDPDPQVLALTTRALELHGIQGHGFTDPLDAIAATERINPDVILCPHRFKSMSGLELIMEIRARARRALPAVILTGDIAVASRDRNRFQQSRIIRKPARPDELAMVIREAAAGIMSELPWRLKR